MPNEFRLTASPDISLFLAALTKDQGRQQLAASPQPLIRTHSQGVPTSGQSGTLGKLGQDCFVLAADGSVASTWVCTAVSPVVWRRTGVPTTQALLQALQGSAATGRIGPEYLAGSLVTTGASPGEAGLVLTNIPDSAAGGAVAGPVYLLEVGTLNGRRRWEGSANGDPYVMAYSSPGEWLLTRSNVDVFFVLSESQTPVGLNWGGMTVAHAPPVGRHIGQRLQSSTGGWTWDGSRWAADVVIFADEDPNDYSVVTVAGALTNGAGNPVVFPPLAWNPGYSPGAWIWPSGLLTPGSSTYEVMNIAYIGGSDKWQLLKRNDAAWTSTADVASPDLIPPGAWHGTNNPHAWQPRTAWNGAIGIPVVTVDTMPGAYIGQRLRSTVGWWTWHGTVWIMDAPLGGFLAFANLAAANEVLDIGDVFYNIERGKLQAATA